MKLSKLTLLVLLCAAGFSGYWFSTHHAANVLISSGQ